MSDQDVTVRFIRRFHGWKIGDEKSVSSDTATVWIKEGIVMDVCRWKADLEVGLATEHTVVTAAELDGRGLADALREFAIGDRKVMALSKPVIAEHPSFGDILKGQFRGRFVSYRWPIRLTADGLLKALESSNLFIMFVDWNGNVSGPPSDPEPSEVVRAFFAALAGRWATIMGFIDRGDVDVLDWESRKIDSRILQSKRVLIDLETSDLFEEGKDEPLRKELGLSLAVTTAMSPRAAVESAEPLADEQKFARPTAIKRRPKGDAVAVALKEAGLDRSHGSFSFKEVAGRIASRMPPPCTTASELDALAKAVKRHYERTIQEGRADNVLPLSRKKVRETRTK
jgi:hypothetical protein